MSAGAATHKATAPVGDDRVPPTRCGTIAIVGRPNVGKSTLLNTLVGQKISITSRKAQTTRHRITGVRTKGQTQYIFVDTPGFQTQHGGALNRNLNRTVTASLAEVDVVLLVVEAGRFSAADEQIVALLPPDKPVILVANKLDLVKRRASLLPWLQELPRRHDFAQYVPLTATRADDADRLLGVVEAYLPQQAWLHDNDALTNRNERFLASEIVREKLFRLTGDELPYTSTVVIDRFEEDTNAAGRRQARVAATIVVQREAHKGIVIGQGGERIKRLGSEARAELERLLDAHVFLELWVKVRSGWAYDEQHLRAYGYE